ncbi:50S ribosomal protein L25 [Candidatus Schneideria nysicola]|uniref:50S ribosomal protein L25 n=1 Tax=Candidatus Schneideria nysicola TaxID=1081631 RepID=UPI001CAA6636|nr:50S ribosomal protein L25 [Candidatus Schneideria nysicola]UAJ65782.1 50S ribosomal protein L25 [Candidatus Schneideria nysicola]
MLTLLVKIRNKVGKSASRRNRRNNKCPAIIYGKDNNSTLPIILDNESILIINKNLILLEKSKNLYSKNKILLKIENKESVQTIIQAIQYHPFKSQIIHVDFMRI